MEEINKLKVELENWANETAEFYHQKAQDPKFDFAFHTQSNLNKVTQSPALLILAINPGVDGKYTEQIINEEWKKWGINGRMDGETLLKGNPWWKNRNEWGFWQRLNNIFNRGGIKDILQNESRFVLSNLTFFTTKKETSLPNVFEECTEKTIKLINILRPKHILCLGRANCIDHLKRIGKFEVKELLPFNCLSYGKFNGIPVYGINHPASRPTIEEMELIGKCLNFLMNNSQKEFSLEEMQEQFSDEIKAVKARKSCVKMPDKTKINAQEIVDYFRENPLSNVSDDKGKTIRFFIDGIDKDKLEITVTTAEGVV